MTSASDDIYYLIAMDFWEEWLPYSMGKSKVNPFVQSSEKIFNGNGGAKQVLVYYQDYVIVN